MGVELLLAAGGIAAILSITGIWAGLTFVLLPKLKSLGQNKKFPIQVPGWGTKMSSSVPFDGATDLDVATLLEHVVTEAEKSGYNKDEAIEKLNNALIEWIPADPDLGGRKVKNQATGALLAGWHNNNTLYVVYLPKDRIDSVALAHECGHELHELKKIIDMNHEDDDMWGKEGIVARAKAKTFQDVYG